MFVRAKCPKILSPTSAFTAFGEDGSPTNIPDALYRRVKARSAREGRTFRSVAIKLLQNWLSTPPSVPIEPAVAEANTAWLAVTRGALRPDQSHDLESIRGSVAASWVAEAAETLPHRNSGKRP